MPKLSIGALLISLALLSCGATEATCSPTLCASGCCDEYGVCQAGTAASACGTPGSTCAACSTTQVCTLGVCSIGAVPRDDAGLTDAGLNDAGLTDAGATDAGLADAGLTDAGLTDAGLTDAGLTDAGLTDAGRTDAGRTDAGVVDAGPPSVGADVLIFRGAGGIAAQGLPYDQCSFNSWSGALPAGHQLVDSNIWPSVLDRFRAVVLVLPGASTQGQGLSSGAITALASWLRAGGRLLVSAEVSFVSGGYVGADANTAANALLSALGVPVGIVDRSTYDSDFSMPLKADHFLGRGGVTLGCDSGARLRFTAGSNVIVVDSTAGPNRIVDVPIGSGHVLVFSDESCLDDSMFKPTPTNFSGFLQNLVTP